MTSSGSGPRHAQSGRREGSTDYQKAAEKLAHADYETRMEHFRRKDASKPITSFGGRPHGGPVRDRTR